MIGESQFLPALDLVIGLKAFDGILNELWVVLRVTRQPNAVSSGEGTRLSSGFVTIPGFGSKTSQYSELIFRYRIRVGLDVS